MSQLILILNSKPVFIHLVWTNHINYRKKLSYPLKTGVAGRGTRYFQLAGWWFCSPHDRVQCWIVWSQTDSSPMTTRYPACLVSNVRSLQLSHWVGDVLYFFSQLLGTSDKLERWDVPWYKAAKKASLLVGLFCTAYSIRGKGVGRSVKSRSESDSTHSISLQYHAEQSTNPSGFLVVTGVIPVNFREGE